MIQLHNVSFTYPNGTEALRNINLRIEKGEFVFLVGPTGTGKSTLLKLLYCAEYPTEGRVIVAGRDVSRLSPKEVPLLRRRLGIIFQDFRLIPTRTVWENIAFALKAIGMGRKEICRKLPEVLEIVGLSDKAHAYPAQLSGGEQQRVAIARAIVNNPIILLADEPTGNLDPETSLEIVDLLARINLMGTTVLTATHDKYIVDKMRKRVVTLQNGRIVSDRERGTYEHYASE
ncbi:cell division ATP-binding protein FtsE [bacterium]|nr:cell division ATP-binding protein FtsE [bacterium]